MRENHYKRLLELSPFAYAYHRIITDDSGSEVLVHFAGLLNKCLRTTDASGRLGGEEFALLLPRTGADKAMSLAERIRSSVEETHIQTHAGTVNMTVSGGLSQFHTEDSTIDDILARADKALYQAKNNGRNRMEVELEKTEK